MKPDHYKDWVAIILAVGIATALNILVFAVLYDAIFSHEPGLSENATQILTGAFGGIIGVLGSYIGFIAGGRRVDQSGTSAVRSDQTPEAPNTAEQQHP